MMMEMDADSVNLDTVEGGPSTREEEVPSSDFKFFEGFKHQDREHQDSTSKPTTSSASYGPGASGMNSKHETLPNNAIVPLRRCKLTVNQQQVREFVKRKENPMTNDVVLENLFQYISAESLSACRMVNKQWNYHSVPAVRKKHSPVIFNKTRHTRRFSTVMKEATNFPYRSFVLRTKYTGRVDKYFKSFGREVKNLQVISRTGRQAIDFDRLYDVLNRTPNIESLDLAHLDFPRNAATLTTDFEKAGGTSLKHLTSMRIAGFFGNLVLRQELPPIQLFSRFVNPIFRRCSRLKILEIDTFHTRTLQVFLNVLQHSPTLDTITIHRITEEEILQLLESRLAFKNVNLKEVEFTQHGRVLRNFMKALKQSLEVLSLHVLANREMIPFTLPRMAALKVLSLDRHFSHDIPPFASIQNGQFLPTLQKLCINQHLMTALLVTDAVFTCTTVVDLTIWMSDLLGAGSRLSMQDDDPDNRFGHLPNLQLVLIQNLPYLFPNLRRLKAVDSRCSTVRGIFTSLPDLEELHISYKLSRYPSNTVINMNKTLSGIPNSDWMSFAMSDWMSSKSHSDVDKQAVMNFAHASANPSLRSFRRLKVLKLSGKLFLSDASVFLTLLTIQPLNNLILRDVLHAMWSNKTKAALSKYHGLITVLDT